MDINVIKNETNEIIIRGYKQLRNLSGKPYDYQQIEEFLANNIINSEKLIQETRSKDEIALEEEFYRRRTLLKRIADGLAWHLLDYDSHAIHGCSIGHSPGFMYGKEGYQTERKFIKDVFQIPSIRGAIQCDITNILRLADVIVVNDDGRVLSIELKGKASRKNSRSIRQKNRHKEIMSFLQHGQDEAITVAGELRRTIKTTTMFSHYWRELNELIIEAQVTGISWRLLDGCIMLTAIDNRLNPPANLFELALREINWDDPFIIISSLGRHLQNNLPQIPITCFPLTIFPIQIDHGIDFLLGNLDSVILVNINGIVGRLRDSGINATLQSDKSVLIEDDQLKFLIDEGAWSKILNEYVTVASFITYITNGKDSLNQEFTR